MQLFSGCGKNPAPGDNVIIEQVYYRKKTENGEGTKKKRMLKAPAAKNYRLRFTAVDSIESDV